MDSRMIPTRFTETSVGDMFVGLYKISQLDVFIALKYLKMQSQNHDRPLLRLKFDPF